MKKLTDVLRGIASDVDFSAVPCENPPEEYCYNGLVPNWIVTIQYKGGSISEIYYVDISTPQYIGTLCWLVADAIDARRYNTVKKYAESANFQELDQFQKEDIKKEISANNEKRKKLYATFGHAMYCQLMFAENDY